MAKPKVPHKRPFLPRGARAVVWGRMMTHPAYTTVPEMALWLDKDRSVLNRLLKQSGLLYYYRAREYKFSDGRRIVKWYIIPPTTFRSFLFAKAHKLWEETMQAFPPSERVISPFAAYGGLLHQSSKKPVVRSSQWPFRQRTMQSEAWKRLKAMPRKRRSPESAAISS